MVEAPWITIVGLGEDGPQGLCLASRDALESAEVLMGPERHLELLPEGSAERVAWPIPFKDGIALLRGFKGRRVVVLASGDPFWFGAGAAIAREFDPGEWWALPAPSTFSLVAARLGWSIEKTLCIGLHAAPLSRLRPHLASGLQAIVLLRDGDAVNALAAYLKKQGYGASRLAVMEAVGGPRETTTHTTAEAFSGDFSHPVCVAVTIAGTGEALPHSSGLPDSVFDTDGVMSKRPIRALTLSALAPRPGELLWDIGGGSGTIAVEWLLSHPSCEAITIEPRADRVGLIRANADQLGVERLEIVEGTAPKALVGLPTPDVVFVGGGLNADLLETLEAELAAGTRVVLNAVTLETETLLVDWHVRKGGDLMRFEIAQTTPLGARRGWKSAYPVVQWSGVL